MNQVAVTASDAPPTARRDTSRLSYKQLPILGSSKRDILDLRGRMTLSTSRVADIAVADPGLALQLLREANVQSRAEGSSEVASVAHAVAVLGIEQTMEVVSRLRTIDSIKPRQHVDGLLHAMARAAHASGLARRWSKRLGDQAAETGALAAFVRHAAELVLWSTDAEARELFAQLHHAGDERARLEVNLIGCSLSELGQRLAAEANLPTALHASVDETAALQPRLAPSVLASAIAQSTAFDWHSARSRELCDLYADLGGTDLDRAIATLHAQTAEVARQSPLGASLSAARYLLLPPGDRFDAEELAAPRNRPAVHGENAQPPRSAPKIVRATPANAAQPAGNVAPPATAPRQAGEAPSLASATPAPPPQPSTDNAQAGEKTASTAPPSSVARRPSAPATTQDAVRDCQLLLAEVRRGATTIQTALPAVVDALREGLGFDRAVFALKNREQETLRARYTSGEPQQPALQIDLSQSNLITRLLQGPQGIWLHAGTREKLWPYLPRTVRAYAGDRDFCVMSLFVRDKGVGIIYADYTGDHIDEHANARFKRIVGEVADALAPRRAADS